MTRTLKEILAEADGLLSSYELPDGTYDRISDQLRWAVDHPNMSYYKYLPLLVKLMKPRLVLEASADHIAGS